MTQDEAFAEIIMVQLGRLKHLIGLQVLSGLLIDLHLTAKARLSGERVPEGLEGYAEILTKEIADAVAASESLQDWVEAQDGDEDISAGTDGRQGHGQAER